MNSVSVLRPRGELDIAAVTCLRPTWLALVDASRPEVVVVDLSEVTFMDVAGWRAVCSLAPAGRVPALRRPSPAVRRLLALLDGRDWEHEQDAVIVSPRRCGD